MSAKITVGDRCEILDLAARYCRATDTSDATAFTQLFTPTGAFRSRRFDVQGTAALQEFVQSEQLVKRGLAHCNFNHVIDAIDADHASMTSYLMVLSPGADDGGQPVVERYGAYVDRLVREADGWKFELREYRPISELGPGPGLRPVEASVKEDDVNAN